MQSNRRRWFVALPFLFLLLLGAAPPQQQQRAQNPAIPTMGESIEVSIINLDVVVTDRDGKRVRGLKPDDFEILENKTARPISNFAEYSSSATAGKVGVETPEAEAAAVQAAPRQQRTVVVFVERMQLRTFEAKPLADAIRALLKKTIGPGDAVSIVLWSPNSDVQMAYTDDPDEIEQGLTRFVEVTSHLVYDPAIAARELVLETMDFELGAQRMAGRGGKSAPTTLDPTRAGEGAAEINAQVAMVEMKRRVNAINATINSMAGREGKKVLILATRRLGEIAGAEFFYTAGMRNLSLDTKTRFGTATLMKTITDNANAAGVTIYPIYPPGLAQAGPNASDRLMEDVTVAVTNTLMHEDVALPNLLFTNEMANLSDIARKTGGIAAGTVRDIVAMLPRVEEDITDYYSLAYRVTSSRTDRARDIAVRAKNPAYTVRARRQYVEKTDTTRMKDRVVATLFRNLDQSPFAIEAEIGAPRRQGRRTVLPLQVRVPIKDLTVLPANGKNAGAFSVFVASSINQGRVSEVTQQTQPFAIAPADMDKATAGYFTYNVDVVVDDATTRVAVGVFDEVGKTYGLLRLPVPGRAEKVAASE